MGEDASLDDFLDTGGGDEDGGNEGAEHSGDTGTHPSEHGAGSTSDPVPDGSPVETPETAAQGAVEPATTTYAWSPEGVACAECGTVVERRWEQDGQLVCGGCKRW